MPTYFNRLPVAFERGEGVWLWDTEGKRYLDAVAGIAVCGLGHAHPAITRVISAQAAKLIHTSNNYEIPNQEKLAKQLCTHAQMEQAYFCNSGAEANESAIKLARLFARKKSIDTPLILTLRHSFHGRSLATLSASGTPRIQEGFEPLVARFEYVDINDAEAVTHYISKEKDALVAIMLEPIQGDGGVRIASNDYLQFLRKMCDEHDLLLILDEVQTGLGRTGKWFAGQHAHVLPDILTVAKTLGNGFPIAACLARDKACNLFGPGKHGTTFGGSPLACAVASEVIRVIEEDNLVQNAQEMGDYLQTQLRKKLASLPGVVEIRGRGLMIGVQLDRPCLDISRKALAQQLLINVVANSMIRLLPPLILTQTEADELVKRLSVCLHAYYDTVSASNAS
ncbi:MAG: aspartate aminotransferase family protein [Gammaproteobacteria bacterium]|nr:aspartate aminotransferase family protein [Gammaproteobacteria bacterium]